MPSEPDQSGSAPATPPVAARDDRALRRDVRALGFELGQVLKRHGRPHLFELVEEIRDLSKRRRAGDAEADLALRKRIASLKIEDLDELVRALACFFDLANLAEDRHRIRVLRQREQQMHPAPRPESLGAAIDTLHAQGLTAEQVQALLDALDIELVFTAHPTEAKRRTVRNALRRLRNDLILLDHGRLLPREKQRLVTRIKTDLDCLWETDTLRPRKPTVLEEVQRSLFVADSLWEVIPWLYQGLRQALARNYPGHAFQTPRFLRFGTWIGGDRDGNPFVTADVTRQTLLILRNVALQRHLEACEALNSVLSISARRQPLAPTLEAALDEAKRRWRAVCPIPDHIGPDEKYRHFLWIIRFRLQKTLEADPFTELPDGAYANAEGLAADLRLIQSSLRETGHHMLADGQLGDWLDTLTVFGFHFARLDIREDSRRLHEAVADVCGEGGLGVDYAALDEDAKRRFLLTPPDEKLHALRAENLPQISRQNVELFVLLHRVAKTFGADALGVAIVSMTHRPSDVLAVLWLTRLGAMLCGDREPALHMPVVPLFETIGDLERAGEILTSLLAEPVYRAHLEASGGVQVCMVGYSDSTKDGGYFAANWNLYEAEEHLAAVARREGVKLTLFHGRGGALGRGGGPAARGIFSLPPDSVAGRIRITEQGEVLAERYDDPEIAYRHLEQVTWATMLVTSKRTDRISDTWRAVMDRAGAASFEAYRELIQDPGFVRYFSQASPIASIESMPIGSRPARRRSNGDERKLEDLRAIPYTFAWTQNRHMLTAFYGLGAGLDAGAAGDWEPLREMYETWPFFRAVIDNAELALAKCDMQIAHAYAQLVEDREAGERIWSRLRDEYHRAVRGVLAITGREDLLATTPWLQRSIRVRNPYVDPLNFIQIELMRRLRSDSHGDAEVSNELLRLTVQGIAAGLRTTG